MKNIILPLISVFISMNAAAQTVNCTGNTPICAGDTLYLFETGGDAENWQWEGPNEFSSTRQSPFITNPDELYSGLYYVTITDINSNQAIDSVDVTVYAKPAVNAFSNSPVCEGEDINFTEGGGDGLSWSWSGPNRFTSINQNPIISSATADDSGIYIVTITNDNACINTDTVDVAVTTKPSISISSEPTCAASLTTYSLEVIVSAGTVTSSEGTVADQGGNIWEITDVPADSNIIVIVDDGCVDTLTVSAPNCDCPTIDAPVSNGDASYCEGSAIPSISASVHDTLTIDWYDVASDGILLQSDDTLYSPSAPGTYYAETRDPVSGCVSNTRTPIEVIELARPVATASNNGAVCTGAQLTLSGGPARMKSYAWSGPESFSSTEQNPTVADSATTLLEGEYSLTITDWNGCCDTASITVIASPHINVGNDIVALKGEYIQFNEYGGDAISWSWSGPDGFSSSNHQPVIDSVGILSNGIYTLSITDSYGCRNIDSVKVILTDTATLKVTNPPVAYYADLTAPSILSGSDGGWAISNIEKNTWTIFSDMTYLNDTNGINSIFDNALDSFFRAKTNNTKSTWKNNIIINIQSVYQMSKMDITSGDSVFNNGACEIYLSTDSLEWTKATQINSVLSNSTTSIALDGDSAQYIKLHLTTSNTEYWDIKEITCYTSEQQVTYWKDSLATIPVNNPDSITEPGMYYIKLGIEPYSEIQRVEIDLIKNETPEFETAHNKTIIYPNPFSHGILHIKVPKAKQKEKIETTIFNMLGEAVYIHHTPANKTSYDIQLLNLKLIEGIYNLQITVGNNYSNHKLIIE